MAGTTKDYIGYGLAAAKPTPPAITPLTGGSARYYATDTGVEYAWDGSAWHACAGGTTTLAGDTDINFSSLTNLDVLQYQTGDSKWHNMPGGMVRLGKTTLGSTTASISFSSIPSGYTWLRLIWYGRGSVVGGASALAIQMNGDTGTNYDYHFAASDGVGDTSLRIGSVPGTTAPANQFGGGFIDIFGYANTTGYKPVVSDNYREDASSGGNIFNELCGGVWKSASAITSLLFFPTSASLLTGTTAALYGIG